MEVSGGPDPKKAKVGDADENGGVPDIPAGRSPCDDQRGLGPDADTAPCAPTLIPGGAMRARHTFTERGAARLDENEEATDRRIGALFLLDLITSHPTWTERKIDVMTSEDTTFIGDIRVHTPSEICTDALVERVNRRRSKYVWNIFLSQSPAWTSRDGEGPNAPVIEALFDPLVGKCGGDSPLTFGDVAPCFSGGSSLTGKDSVGGDTVHPLNVDPSTPMLAVNLWYSPDGSKSSLHFDDYHNVLCVVAGTKTVRLWRPGKYLDFYAENPLGESANHSGVDVTGASYEPGTDTKDLFPEFFNHEGTGAEIPPDETYVLTPGDCLFIPEGWWHWVDSTPGTMAVNFWWESPFAIDLAAKVEPLLTFDLPPATLNERCDALMGALKGELESGLTQYRRRKIFAACGRVEKHRCVVSMTHCHGAWMFRRQSSLSNTKWGRRDHGENFTENFPFYELFADRLCYDVKKISFGYGHDPRDFERRWPDPHVDGIPHHARLETHHDDVFKIGVDILRWIAYSTPQELWDFLKYLAERPYFLGADCDDEFKAWKTNTLRLLLIVFVSNNDRACELMTYKLEMCESGKDVDTVRRFYGLVYAFLSHEEKVDFTAGLLRRKDSFAWKFCKHVAYNVLEIEDLAAVLGRNVAGRGCTSEGMAPHSAHLANLLDPDQLESSAYLEVATGRLDVAWTKHWETQPEHDDAPKLTEEQCYEAIAELDKQKNI